MKKENNVKITDQNKTLLLLDKKKKYRKQTNKKNLIK